MLSPKVFYKYWKTSLSDFVGSMIAFWVTLFTSVEYGIAAAVTYSLVYVLLRITFARINEAILFPNAYKIKNVIIEKIRTATRALPPDDLEKSGERLWNQPLPSEDERILPSHSDDSLPLLREIIIDVRGVNYIDVTGTQALHDLKAELQSHAGQRIRFVFVGMPVTPNIKTTLERTGWSLVMGEGRIRDRDGDLDPDRTTSSEGSERIRDGGDVFFDFVHSALYETSLARPLGSSSTQHIPREGILDKVGSTA
ncbi:SulP family sulfate permease [Diaporthe eres]|nr:SulP family sulfate permease [Diaporthe eres]